MKLFLMLVIVVFAVLLGSVVGSIIEHGRRVDSFKTHCRDAGGHIYAPQVIFCLGDGGRLLEVYP